MTEPYVYRNTSLPSIYVCTYHPPTLLPFDLTPTWSFSLATTLELGQMNFFSKHRFGMETGASHVLWA